MSLAERNVAGPQFKAIGVSIWIRVVFSKDNSHILENNFHEHLISICIFYYNKSW